MDSVRQSIDLTEHGRPAFPGLFFSDKGSLKILAAVVVGPNGLWITSSGLLLSSRWRMDCVDLSTGSVCGKCVRRLEVVCQRFVGKRGVL